jgi:hypothetical protein
VDTTEWKEKKEFIEELKRQWKLLWMERIDDKTKAEGIASKDFSLLFVERGTIIMATRDFKALDFMQILHEHKLVHIDGMVSQNPTVGGWGKFAREVFGRKREKRQMQSSPKLRCLNGSQKKGGRGWLHARL